VLSHAFILPSSLDMSDPEHYLLQKIDNVIASRKIVSGRMIWSYGSRIDYVRCDLRCICEDVPDANLKITLTSQTSILPMKSSFTISMGGQRIFSLDTNPRRSHSNNKTLGSFSKKHVVNITHWTRYPCTNVVEDVRKLTHRAWFDAFLMKANAEFNGTYRGPRFKPEQWELGL
jgi:hypothetical protein